MSPLRSALERLETSLATSPKTSILAGCVLVAGMLGALWVWVLVGGADPPAQEPDSAPRPHLTPDASQEFSLGRSARLDLWEQAMDDAGICFLIFPGSGAGVQISVRNGTDCAEGPVISFPEFRRRMELPERK